MVILEQAIADAGAAGIDTSTAVSLKEEMGRMFVYTIRWSVNDEYYLLMRNRIMNEIDKLQWYMMYGEPSADILSIVRNGGSVEISCFGDELYRYNLLRSTDIAASNWQVVDSLLVTASDTITLVDSGAGAVQKAFYKVQAVMP